MTVTSAIAAGFCHCGCGVKTPLASQSKASKGWVKGEPVRFLPAHNLRVRGKPRVAVVPKLQALAKPRSLADRYGEEFARLGGRCPFEVGTMLLDANHECRHGFIPSKRHPFPPCDCWRKGAPR